MGFANQGSAQDTFAPLFLYTNGSGSVLPLQNGQSLEVGQYYEMTATPALGYVFSGWQVVNVFIITETNFNTDGEPILPPVVSTVQSPVPTYTNDATLQFAMQAEINITSAGSNPSIVRAFGWQANFVPVPIQLQAVSTNNTFQLTVTMQSSNYTTIVQTSPDMLNWTNVCTNIPPFTFTDSMTNPACFYRAEVATN